MHAETPPYAGEGARRFSQRRLTHVDDMEWRAVYIVHRACLSQFFARHVSLSTLVILLRRAKLTAKITFCTASRERFFPTSLRKGTDIADHNCGSQNPAFNQRIKKEISTC